MARGMRGEVKRLLEEAYNFGYFVGYKGHSEWVRWIRDKREEIYKKAEELGVYDLIKEAYKRGKKDGARRREEEIHLSLIEKGTVQREEEVKPRVEMGEAEEEPEVEFARFLKTARLILPPEFLDTLKHLDLPKMLRMGEE